MKEEESLQDFKDFHEMSAYQKKRVTKESVEKIAKLIDRQLATFQTVPKGFQKGFDPNIFLHAVDRLYLLNHACIAEVMHMCCLWDIPELAQGIKVSFGGFRNIYEALVDCYADKVEEVEEYKNSTKIKFIYSDKPKPEVPDLDPQELKKARAAYQLQREEEENLRLEKERKMKEKGELQYILDELNERKNIDFADPAERQLRKLKAQQAFDQKIEEFRQKIDKGEKIDLLGIKDTRLLIQLNKHIYSKMIEDNLDQQTAIRKAVFSIDRRDNTELQSTTELMQVVMRTQRCLEMFDAEKMQPAFELDVKEVEENFQRSEMAIMDAFDTKQRQLICKVVDFLRKSLKTRKMPVETQTNLTSKEVDTLERNNAIIKDLPPIELKKDYEKLRVEMVILNKMLNEEGDRVKALENKIKEKDIMLERARDNIDKLNLSVNMLTKMRQDQLHQKLQSPTTSALQSPTLQQSQRSPSPAAPNQISLKDQELKSKTKEMEDLKRSFAQKQEVLDKMRALAVGIGAISPIAAILQEAFIFKKLATKIMEIIGKLDKTHQDEIRNEVEGYLDRPKRESNNPNQNTIHFANLISDLVSSESFHHSAQKVVSKKPGVVISEFGIEMKHASVDTKGLESQPSKSRNNQQLLTPHRIKSNSNSRRGSIAKPSNFQPANKDKSDNESSATQRGSSKNQHTSSRMESTFGGAGTNSPQKVVVQLSFSRVKNITIKGTKKPVGKTGNGGSAKNGTMIELEKIEEMSKQCQTDFEFPPPKSKKEGNDDGSATTAKTKLSRGKSFIRMGTSRNFSKNSSQELKSPGFKPKTSNVPQRQNSIALSKKDSVQPGSVTNINIPTLQAIPNIGDSAHDGSDQECFLETGNDGISRIRKSNTLTSINQTVKMGQELATLTSELSKITLPKLFKDILDIVNFWQALDTKQIVYKNVKFSKSEGISIIGESNSPENAGRPSSQHEKNSDNMLLTDRPSSRTRTTNRLPGLGNIDTSSMLRTGRGGHRPHGVSIEDANALDEEYKKNQSTITGRGGSRSHRQQLSLMSMQSQPTLEADDEDSENALLPNNSTIPKMGGGRPLIADKVPDNLNILVNNKFEDEEFIKKLYKNVHASKQPGNSTSQKPTTHSKHSSLALDYATFKSEIQNFASEHKSCGQSCPHLLRFYERFGLCYIPRLYLNKTAIALPLLDMGKKVITAEQTSRERLLMELGIIKKKL